MSEASMWETVRKKLQGFDPVRVENVVDNGTPDVDTIHGWIELKYKAEWPKRPSTPLRLPHFTPQQRTWLFRRVMSGGRAFLLLKVANDWLLFDGAVASRVLGEKTKDELIALSLAYWPNSLLEEEFRTCLKTYNFLNQRSS